MEDQYTKKAEVKRVLLSILAILSLGIFLPSYQALAWGPERDTYEMTRPSKVPTMNSITDNPVLGDERNFVRVAELGAYGEFVDEIQIVPGKEYEVYIGYHNNAAANYNEGGTGIAQQVRLSTQFPSVVTPDQKGKVSAIISAYNTVPLEVWDEAYFTSTEEVTLRYKEGSAKIYNSWATNGRVLSESMFSSSGTYLGANELDGFLPGCAEYSGHVIYVLIAEQPQMKITKTVSLDGEKFFKNVTAEVGQKVTYKVEFENTGNTAFTNVTFHDKFPDGMKLVPNTTYMYNNSHPDGELLSDLIDKNGYNTGRYAPGASATLIYEAEVTDYVEKNGDCGDNRLVNMMYVDHDGGETSDGATVIVNRECAVTVTTLPESGPGEIALAVIAVLSIGVGGAYWYRSRRMLKRVSDDVEGH